MAQESCNLDKEEPELLKPQPPSAPSSNPAPPQPATAATPALFLKPSSQDQHHQLQQQLGPRDAPMPGSPTNSSISSISCFSRKRKLEASLLHAPPEADAVSAVCEVVKVHKSEAASDAPTAAAKSTVNRCTCCQKRVGLTGFRCRCGHLFCAQHRYSNAHGCSYDYKAAGRAEISKANPVVKAPKIIKI